MRPDAGEEELRAAYRRMVRLHHPDHNGGSRASTIRFEEVQEAYAQIVAERRSARAPGTPSSSAAGPANPDLEARIAAMERDLRAAQDARERAREAARRAAADAAADQRPSDEELGYVRTEDSFTKILDDALDELQGRLRRNTP